MTLAMFPVRAGARQLVPDAAIATDVIAYDGAQLVLHSAPTTRPHVANEGSTPLAWWQPGADQTTTVLMTGEPAAIAFASSGVAP